MQAQPQNVPIFKAVHSANLGDRLLRRVEVEHKTGLSRSAIYDGVRKGTFPEPVPLGGKSVAWLCSEIDEWIADKVAKRNQKSA